jgi:hypothetical protein
MKHNLNAEIAQWKEQVVLLSKKIDPRSIEEENSKPQIKLAFAEWSVDEILCYASVNEP